MIRRSLLVVSLLSLLTVGAAQSQSMANSLTDAERAAGWKLLFEGQTTAGWRGYLKNTVTGWQVVDGALTRAAEGGDIITTEQYRNFELALEWKIGPGGNSGVFYRAVEGPSAIYFSAPEMQVLDDALHADGQFPLTSAGSNYGLHPAPRGVVRPVGEWNAVRIVVQGNQVEHWLNGRLIVRYRLQSHEWKALVAGSKFAQWKEYGQAAEGYIGLQDHGDWVAFRSIRIRVLP
ncbi:MAG: DUF1080 domain-containing protein [Gemmatimonadota bacterium]